MKIKINDLEGNALNRAVAKALGKEVWLRHDFLKARYIFLESTADLAFQLENQDNLPIFATITDGATAYIPDYSADGEECMAIVAEHHISILAPGNTLCWPWIAEIGKVRGYSYGNDRSPIVAAMRCLVAYKLGIGDEVEVPDFG